LITLAFGIINNAQEIVVPKLLSPKVNSMYGTITLFLSIGILLITFARMSSSYFLVSIARSIYKNRSIEKITQEEMPLTALSSFCLIVNFLICASCLLYLTVDFFHETISTSTLLAIIYTPILFLFGPFIFLNLVEYITGEKGITKAIKLTNWAICKFLGILFSILVLIWVFNDQNAYVFAYVLWIILCICYIYRIFRGIIFAFSKGISWYYIILYFCMFEIIPMYPIWMLVEGKL
jgi:hypothetical protein